MQAIDTINEYGVMEKYTKAVSRKNQMKGMASATKLVSDGDSN